jgi:competence protein ComEA
MGSLSLTVGRRRLAAAAVVAMLLLGLLWRHVAHGPGAAPLRVAPIATVTPAAAPASGRASAAGGIVVDVVGAVRRPGVYRLPRGARVQAAVARAGGLTPRADLVGVNLAAPLADGEQVVVAARGSPTGSVGAASGAPVSLSSATAEQLDSLPGVGPVTAQKIIEYRQQHGAFTSVDELDAIPGIGSARLKDLQGLVVP